MFLFINPDGNICRLWRKFKYISCSYLSSPVNNNSYALHIFKYISCSYLSNGIQYFRCFRWQFKYISCSYLSISSTSSAQTFSIQIHLMFLFIQACVSSLTILYYSNTSHVLIYRNMDAICKEIFVIQIHLMFVFIPF